MAELIADDLLDEFLSNFSPEAVAASSATRKLILKIFPDAIETAEGKELGYGFDRGYKGLVFTVSHKKAGINIGIAGGAALEDPFGLLIGSGKLHRHVEIIDVKKINDPNLTDLLKRAVASKRAAFSEVSAKQKR